MKLINLKRHLFNFKSILWILLLIGMTAISACSSGSTSTETNVGGSSSSAALTGVFLDSPVEGLNYQTASINGITDSAGTFIYHEGETVTFLIGDILLGSAPGKHIMTPIDLIPGAVDETDPTVTNICRLLQSIDWDGDLTNGIMITDAIRAEMSGRMIDFTKSIDMFDDYDVEAFFDTMNVLGKFKNGDHRSLHTSAEAQNHFRQTLMDRMGDMHSNDSSFGNFDGTQQNLMN